MKQQTKILVTTPAISGGLASVNNDRFSCKGSMLPNCQKCLGLPGIETPKARLDPPFVVLDVRARRRLKSLSSPILAWCPSISFVGRIADIIIE